MALQLTPARRPRDGPVCVRGRSFGGGAGLRRGPGSGGDPDLPVSPRTRPASMEITSGSTRRTTSSAASTRASSTARPQQHRRARRPRRRVGHRLRSAHAPGRRALRLRIRRRQSEHRDAHRVSAGQRGGSWRPPRSPGCVRLIDDRSALDDRRHLRRLRIERFSCASYTSRPRRPIHHKDPR